MSERIRSSDEPEDPKVRTYSGDEFEKKMKDVDRYVDSIVGKLELSGSDALLFFSMATAVSAYYAGYILEDTKEMVQSLFNFSLFIDREPKYGEIGPSDVGQDEYCELFDISQDLMNHYYKELSHGEPKSRKEMFMTYMDALWEIAHMPVSIVRRSSDPIEASKTMFDNISETWEFIENQCTVVSDQQSDLE